MTISNMEKDCKWYFAQHLGGREDGPNDPMQENFKQHPYSSLIRESIQNSLDVPVNSEQPVRVEFKIDRIRPIDYPNFFELKKHIEGCISHFINNSDAESTYGPMINYLNNLKKTDNSYYIKIADYNTKGMTYRKGDTTQPFYAFVRAAGVSSKQDATAGGSFGFGKAAYFYISPLRTILVSTKTPDNQIFFEGVSSLCTHKMGNQKDLCVSVGYYDNNNGEPIDNPDNIPARFQREEPGTDIYIMGITVVKKESIYQEMIEAVLRNFWMAIESNKLEVLVDEIKITHNTLPSLMEKHFPDKHDTTRRETSYNPRPYWEAVHNVQLNKKQIIFFEENLPTIGHVRFYALKSKNATDKIIYMRKPLMLVKARRTQSTNGFYGVFICDDSKGNEYLRKTENPAHNEWKPNNWRDNGRCNPKGSEAFNDVKRFIIHATEKMFSSQNHEVQHIQGLEEFLYIPTAIEDDNDFETSSLLGDVIDIQDAEGNQISSELNNPIQNPPCEKPAIGKVIISDPIEKKQNRNIEGGHLSGHGTRIKKKKGGGEFSSGHIEGHFDNSEDGIQGPILIEIPVRYRSFAQMENGQIIHKIIIHSDYDFENGRIDLIVGGEQSDDVVAIQSCSLGGQINANSISGLHINKGKNTLEVIFADNMKHAVKLDAYELK